MEKTLIIGLFIFIAIVEATEYGAKLNNYQIVPKTQTQSYVPSQVKPLTVNKVQVHQMPISSQQQIQNPFSIQSTASGNVRPFSSSVAAAVQSKRFIELISYSNQFEPVQPQVIEIDAITAPVQFVFRSASGPLLFQQVHVPSIRQDPQHTRSEEPAQLLSHEVYKPIIQELREIIQPYRHVTQEVKPVLEEVRTIVAHGDKSLPTLVEEQQGLDLIKQQQSQQPELQQNGQLQQSNLQASPSHGVKTVQQVPETKSNPVIDFA